MQLWKVLWGRPPHPVTSSHRVTLTREWQGGQEVGRDSAHGSVSQVTTRMTGQERKARDDTGSEGDTFRAPRVRLPARSLSGSCCDSPHCDGLLLEAWGGVKEPAEWPRSK